MADEENEEYEPIEEYNDLLAMVQKEHPDVTKLKRICRQVIVVYHDNVDNTIRPLCRVAVCEDYAGIVTYFLVAIFFNNEWCYYISRDW